MRFIALACHSVARIIQIERLHDVRNFSVRGTRHPLDAPACRSIRPLSATPRVSSPVFTNCPSLFHSKFLISLSPQASLFASCTAYYLLLLILPPRFSFFITLCRLPLLSSRWNLYYFFSIIISASIFPRRISRFFFPRHFLPIAIPLRFFLTLVTSHFTQLLISE